MKLFSRLAAILFGLIPLGSSAVEFLSEQDFTQKFASQIQAMGLNATVTITGPLTISVEVEDKDATIIYLNNGYAEYKAAPENLDAIVSKFAAYAKESISPPKSTELTSLLPAVRDLEYIKVLQDTTRQSFGDHKDDELAVLPLFGELGIIFVFDSDTAISFATWQAIDELAVARNDVMDIALKNLEHTLIEPQIHKFEGFVGMDSGGAYQSSLFLTDTFWQKQKFGFKGDLVAFPATRDAIFLTGSDEVEGLKAAQAMATQWVNEQAYPMSANPIVLRDGKWGEFHGG